MTIDTTWKNIAFHEGEIFKTVSGIEYSYVLYGDYILINNDERRKVTKDMFNVAIHITNPTPSKIQAANVWGPSYVWGIITDNRIFS